MAEDWVENFPAAHGSHTEDVEAPIRSEYVPAEHGVHAGDAGDVAYFPAAHGEHMAPLACEVVPASQDVHTVAEAAPDFVAYLPARHRVHADADVVTMYFPGAQLRQVATEDAPVCAENVPSAHT